MQFIFMSVQDRLQTVLDKWTHLGIGVRYTLVSLLTVAVDRSGQEQAVAVSHGLCCLSPHPTCRSRMPYRPTVMRLFSYLSDTLSILPLVTLQPPSH